MSDEEEQINPKNHKQLLQAISSLGKTQHIRKSTRDEPKLQQDEFQLVKGAAVVSKDKAQPVGINDLVQVLRGTKKHLDAGKQLKAVATTKKVLQKPLEKPAAERIKRTIGYENVKKKLAKWDAVVATNRAAETQVFPLKSETVYVNTSLHRRKPLDQSVRTDLMLQMEELENKYAKLKREHMGDTQDPAELEKREQQLLKKKLTKEELIARRKELAYLKMRESQKSAKARLQNKIKSKKYHKLMKKQKLQEQIKHFELLQKTNPEAAMEKLNQLEKSRVLERANLRHKNTGTWAKNLQVRAKYDKDVRKDLAEQLQISRQLTQKTNENETDEEGDDDKQNKPIEQDEEMDHDPFNPWTTVGKNGKEPNNNEREEQTNWRKYWLERNDNEKMLEEYKRLLKENATEEKELDMETEGLEETNRKKEDLEPIEATSQNKLLKKRKSNAKHSDKIKLKTSKKPKMENGWLVEEIMPVAGKSIDDIFDAQEDKIKEKLQKKLDIISQKGKNINKNKKKTNKLASSANDALKNLNDLSFKTVAKRPVIDEELKYELDDERVKEKVEKLNGTLNNVSSSKSLSESATTNNLSSRTECIDPNKLAAVRLKQNAIGFSQVNEAMADVDVDEENEDPAAEQQMTIAEAFEDDDIIADFSKDKAQDSELKNAEIQLAMPGWGSWAGAGISKEKIERRNKRLLLKLAPQEKRKDENKDNVYINEDASKKLRTHLVSDVPFPFTSLKDYEASIRTPIGRNFVTETAFRMLTRPSVITQKGKIIEPMDESELVKPPRKLRNPIDIRIAKLAEAK